MTKRILKKKKTITKKIKSGTVVARKKKEIQNHIDADKINNVLYEISNSSLASGNLDELYKSIHTSLGKVINVQNFYIAIYDKEKDLISFPYFVDDFDDQFPPKKPGKGLTEYVLRKGKPILATTEVFEELVKNNEVMAIGADSFDWLGVPLIISGKPIGVMAIQSYDEKTRFSENDLSIMSFVSSQIAFAIERKAAEVEKDEWQTRYDLIVASSRQVVYDYNTKTGEIIWSGNIKDILGHTRTEMGDINVWESKIHPDDRESALKELDRCMNENEPYEVEYRFRKSNNEYVHMSDNGFFITDKSGKAYRMLGMMTDITEAKKAKQIQKESEELFKVFFENAAIGLVFLSHTGKIIKVNNSFCKMLGYKENELYEKTFYDITYTDDIDISNLHMNKLINGETNVVNFDKRYVHKSGKLIWVNLHSSLIRSEEGKTLYFIVQIQDITKRKSTEEALRKSEDRFRKYFELPLIGIAITKPDRSWLAVNDKMCNILGYSRKELYTKDWMELTPPEDVNEELKRYNEFLTNEEAGGIPFEKRYIRKDEKIIYVQVSTMSVKDDAGIIDYLISVVEDITERKTAQNNLILLTERFLLSKESANIGIWEWNISTNELIWDKEMLKLYDRKQSEFKGSFEDWESSVLNEDVEKTKRLLEECIREVNDFDTEFRIMHKNGAIRYIKAYGKIQKDKNGRPKKMLGVNWDITTLKIVEEQLRIEKERAEELNRLKTNFLANMSHELRTPMVGILGFSEVLGNIITDEQQKDMVDIINKSGKRLLDTLNLILDLSRVESNKQEIDIRETNLTEKAAESVRLFVAAAANKNLYLTLSKPDGDVYALLDERLLNSILENLVNNAIKYTKSGGIEITVCKVKSDGKRWASLSVTDTGIGIPKDSHNLVFEEFRQVSEGFDRAYEGTGLGLTITKKFAELMKGEISLKSELGKGTTFTINFPLVESYSETISEIESIIPESEVSNKIITDNKIPYALLIDDDEIIYKVISKILEGICYVDYAEKADIALEKVKEKKYSLIFLDINLGLGNNGLEVLKEIRNVNGYENVPVSALTAYAMTGDKEKFLNAGCDYYISKPFERKKILDSVKQMLKNKKSN